MSIVREICNLYKTLILLELNMKSRKKSTTFLCLEKSGHAQDIENCFSYHLVYDYMLFLKEICCVAHQQPVELVADSGSWGGTWATLGVWGRL